jgi:formylglycine-generating enzyme required for sulfatase activity
LSFDGVDDYVEAADDASLDITEGTVVAWIKSNFSFQNDKGVVAKSGAVSATDGDYGFIIWSNRIQPIYKGVRREVDCSKDVVSDKGWHHIAVVYDSCGIHVFVDGHLDGESPSYPSPISTNDYSLVIGEYHSTGYNFKGVIDDVRIYDRPLSEEEITEILGPKASAPNPADGAIHMDANSVLSWSPGKDAVWHDVYFGTDFDDVNDANTSSAEYQGRQDANRYDPSGLELDTRYYWRIDEHGDIGYIKGDVWSFRTWVVPNLVGWWKFDKGSGTTAYDSAGDNHGTISGAQWTTGQIDGALSFDGVSDYVDLTDFDLPENFAVCLWVNPTTTADDQCFIAKNTSEGDNIFLFGFWSGGHHVRVRSDVHIEGTKTKGWQQLVVVAEQIDSTHTNISVYRNSKILWTHILNDVVGDMSGKAWTIAQEWDAGSRTDFFNGLIDDVRIYDRALSVEEILQLCQEGFGGRAFDPDPAEGATAVAPDVVLNWVPGTYATSHDVYFGTGFSDVNDADTSWSEYKGNQEPNSYDPAGDLEPGTSYYWRVDERGDTTYVKGDAWSFTVAYINLLGMTFIKIQPGTFQMGSETGEWDEKPVHNVTISQEFYIQETEVTAEQYRQFDPSYSLLGYATGLSWYEAEAFADWLSDQEGLPYRLPTEAEWEYVCTNPRGVTNMQSSPGEWVLDWHGEYPYDEQVDPVGPEQGLGRVVRGRGLDSDGSYYRRPSSRAGIGPGFAGRQHPIGFRLVLGELPVTSPLRYEPPFVRECIKQSTARALQGPDPNVPYFNQRPMLPIPPDNSSRNEIDGAGLHPSLLGHNHSPGMEVCPNGDVLLVIYSAEKEYGQYVSLMGSRLRFGSQQWDMPTPMFDFPRANDHAPLLWNDDGTLHVFWGCPRLDGAGPYPFQWVSSDDSGASWGEVKFPSFVGTVGSHSRQPINSALRVGDTIYIASDGSGGQSVLWKSDNNGATWYDPGGRTGGRHTTFVLLNDGRILGMGGKNTHIGGYMPKSISSDGGQTWDVSITPFTRLGTNQRPCIARLASGRLFFCSDFQKWGKCYRAPGITEKGALVALSEDEGETWYIKKIPTALPHERGYCGGAATLGYSVARQAANGIIHLITSMNHPCQHFEMNEAWILDPSAGGDLPADPGDSGVVNEYEETYPSGALKASWSAKTCDDGRCLLHGTETWYYESGGEQYEVTYYNGRKVGSETYRAPDGAIRWNWQHETDGTSLWTQCWSNGLKRVESNWRDGGMVADGNVYHWSRCGMPEAAWNFIDGRLAGGAALPRPQLEDFEPERIYYVDADSTGANDGSSWADAFTCLQDALAVASSCEEIRVAEGIYKPDEGIRITPGDRYATFQLKNGVAISGGYAGFGEADPNARDVDIYETILSGDLNGDDGSDFANNGENSYHVVTGAAVILDGFTITAGNADGSDDPNYRGGGMLNRLNSSPVVTNCTFSGNWATFRGGGMFNDDYSRPTVINCTFRGNSAGGWGGGMENDEYSSSTVTNCTFIGNTAGAGGGMGNDEACPTLTNCTFVGNEASYGGGIYNSEDSSITLTNCILWANSPDQISLDDEGGAAATITYSDVQGGWEGEGDIDVDPCFVDVNSNDYRLRPGSSCIDAGLNAAVPADLSDLDGDGNTTEPIPWDLDGNPRMVDGNNDGNSLVDMGAYEFFWPPIEVAMRFTPQSLNPGAQGRWVRAHFVLPEGFTVEDVDTNSPAKIIEPFEPDIESEYMNVFVNESNLVGVEAGFERAQFCSGVVDGNALQVSFTARTQSRSLPAILNTSGFWPLIGLSRRAITLIGVGGRTLTRILQLILLI